MLWDNATFDNISVIPCRTVLLVKETRVAVSNHRPAISHWQTLSHIEYTSPWARLELTTLVVIGTECTGRPLYVLSHLTIAFTVVLWRTASDYHFTTFKPFLLEITGEINQLLCTTDQLIGWLCDWYSPTLAEFHLYRCVWLMGIYQL